MDRRSAKPTIQIDNDQVRVTRWSFPPKGETGWHRHEFEYVVVPLTTGRLILETAEEETPNQLIKGESYYRPRGAEHNVVNLGETDFEFVEIEFK